MKGRNQAEVARLKARIADVEALIAKWERINDPESKWMLFLLREAVEMGRIRLREQVRSHSRGD